MAKVNKMGSHFNVTQSITNHHKYEVRFHSGSRNTTNPVCASACYPPLSVTPQNTASHSVTNRGYVSTQDHKIPQICHVTIFLFLCY